ncbi:alpha/beta fold hydrolase [Nocardioides sp. Kera G14]|uniref:alpha/beta fold hydrolase n=1 Tax=Nocardioides sp. Kera G14 TaxID=2884264 RepID=UPI001D1250C9|nr:alpha/beta fold hydrolase [Nocardioides sp. Kera G14]UDY23815.1 alpha/beta hydrolase [Nocardioides sp. Kera G14]
MSTPASQPSATVLTRSEGTSWTLMTWRAADASAPLLFLHPAMGMPATYYHRFGEQAAKAGFHVALTELRGHEAEGGRIPSHRYDFGYQDMVDDLSVAMDEAQRQFPDVPVVLLGHSMGGQVGTAYVASHPGRVAGLILIGAGTPYWKAFGRWMLGGAPLAVLMGQVLGHFPGERFKFAGRESKGLIRDWAKLALTNRLTGATRAQLDASSLPVLAFTIAGDSLAPDESVQGLVAQLPAAEVDWQHLDIEGIDHFKWARRPDSVLPQITAWAGALVGDPA